MRHIIAHYDRLPGSLFFAPPDVPSSSRVFSPSGPGSIAAARAESDDFAIWGSVRCPRTGYTRYFRCIRYIRYIRRSMRRPRATSCAGARSMHRLYLSGMPLLTRDLRDLPQRVIDMPASMHTTFCDIVWPLVEKRKLKRSCPERGTCKDPNRHDRTGRNRDALWRAAPGGTRAG